jgi:hypothetical protein
MAKKKGLNGIAITDHNTILGAIEARRINDDPEFIVIIGQEIATEVGDLIGLFLHNEVRSRDSKEVADEIHSQGGIVVMPHPCNWRLSDEKILQYIDVIECFNSRASVQINENAIKLAEKHCKPVVCGSDAHLCSEIGTCKVVFSSADIINDIIYKRIRLETAYTPVYYKALSQIIKCVKLHKYSKIPRAVLSFIVELLKDKWAKID